MTQEELFYSIFENIPRQGPGTKASTLKAFSAIKTLPQDAQILDIGCGKGVQTSLPARCHVGRPASGPVDADGAF